MINWSDYPNFSEGELQCRHTGICQMQLDFMARLQALRTAYNQPMTVTSGYRDASHPVEAAKRTPGAHATGRAVDIACTNAPDRFKLVQLAFEQGFTGIGISSSFLHLDDCRGEFHAARPAIWRY